MRLTLTLTLCDGQRARTAQPEESGAAASRPLEITPTRIIAGQEAVSSLYAYEILVKTPEEPGRILEQLGKRVSLLVKEGDKVLHRVFGVVMSIESTRSYTPASAEQTEAGKELSWYKWTIRPALAKACYSRNRLVYNSDELKNISLAGVDESASPAEKLLHLLTSRWDAGSLCISAKARQHLPSFIQLIQNDESDYNFFTRLLAAWGLAFVWTMPDAEDGAEQRERLCLFDAVEADREPFATKAEGERAKEDAALAVMEPVSSHASLWKAHYGVGDLSEGEVALQNYRDVEKGATGASADAVRFSVHDESWDQLTAAPEAQRILATARAARAVSRCCHGQYRYPNGSEAFQALSPGRKVAWREGSRLQGNLAPEYAIIRQSVAATDQNWVVTIDAVPTGVDTAIGVLPRPVRVADRPNLSDSPLTEAEAWPEPRLRCFLAVVEDTSCYGEDDTRNLCKVREIAAWSAAQEGGAKLSNALWVEVASPYADKNSGLLARPRIGNVLVCLDRGDLSIPLALTALFRNSNEAPLARLMTIDRRTRTAASAPTTDVSAVTLRNRTHLPKRTYTASAEDSGREMDLDVPSVVHSGSSGSATSASSGSSSGSSDAAKSGSAGSSGSSGSSGTAASDSGSSGSASSNSSTGSEGGSATSKGDAQSGSGSRDSSGGSDKVAEDATRPMSVTELAANPLPFSQIQLISLDNGVRPVEQREDITNTYLASSVVETVMGFVSEADSSSGYAMAGAAQSAQTIYNSPITRPHFEGVNIYSNSDVLLQSADHQIVNAGGEIVVTAAQGITLRVGKSSIRITESGIQIQSATGKVLNPGAYPAYNTEEQGQSTHLMSNAGLPMSGSILVDSSGVATKGPYVTSIATNQVKSSTVLGSALTVTDFSAKLYAPEITIIGGATIQDTFLNGLIKGVLTGKDIYTTASGTDSFYNSALVDGWKTKGLTAVDFAGSAISTVTQVIGWAGVQGISDKFSSLLSVTGSMIKMNATAMTQASPQIWHYHNHLSEIDTPLAGFFAMSERSSLANIAKKIPSYSWVLGGAVTAGMSVAGGIAGSVFGKKADDADSFTKPIPTDRPNTTSFEDTHGLGSSIGAGVGLAAGLSASLIAKFTSKITASQLMETLGKKLYLSKLQMSVGMAKLDALKDEQTALQKQTDALDKSDLALMLEESAASEKKQTVASDDQGVAANDQKVSESDQAVDKNDSIISHSAQKVSSNEQDSINTQTVSLNTHSGTSLNI